jgi:hypothetical protein
MLLVAGPTLAAEVDFSVLGGVTYSDNIERLSDGLERSSSAAVVGLELRGERPAGRLRYDAAADMSYNEYLSLNLKSEIFGRAALRGSYDFVPQSFSWNGSVAYDQIRADVLRPLAPGNTEGLLTLSTGPTLRARFSGAMEGQLDGHFVRTSYGDRPFDNETVGGRALLIRRANPRSMLALGASYDDVAYVSGVGASALDFDRREVFARAELASVRTDINLEAGYADISGPNVDEGGPMLRARFSRRMTPSLTGYIDAVREFPTSEDLSRTFNSASPDGSVEDGALLTSGPRQSTRFEGGWRFNRPRVQAELAYARREEESRAGVLLERVQDEFRVRVSRRFNPGVRGSFFAAITKEDFSGSSGSFDERLVGVELGVAFGTALGLDFRVEHRKRDGLTALNDYSELGAGLFLRYSGSLGGDATR